MILLLSDLTDMREQFFGAHNIKFFDFYCANDKIISLGPKKSIETYISKKNSFHDDKRLQSFLPCFIESERPQKIN